MKKIVASTIVLLGLSASISAQTLNVTCGNVTCAFQSAQTGTMTYQNGETMTIMGKTFNISDITKMYVDQSEVTDNTVAIAYNGTEATVTVSGNIAQYVSPTVSGAHVTIDQSSDVSDDVCGEITYTLTGTSADGEFTLNGSYKPLSN